MPATLIFIRHGETDWNRELRFQGQRDIPLNDKGRGQAKRNGDKLKEFLDADAYDFFASPLSRARETMEIIRHAMGLDPTAYHTDERLRELSFGEWEGYTVHDLETSQKDQWDERARDKWHFTPKGGESYHALTERVRGWIDEVSEPAVVVAHGGVLRSVQVIVAGADPKSLAGSQIPQDRILILEGSKPRWV